ncbi:MAG TPA: isoprenylcysteine carboxylmethyltransferase family protein [candidate division Zixibacteria bacterium]|nr:isoprenylcysteine carboxylmethyltransferase family protein [candidate division Zixibacteria bacterium]
MESLRYLVALGLVVALPPLFLYWLLIHPLVHFWRARGIALTYTIVLTAVALAMMGLFSIRHYLLETDFGTRYPLVALGTACLALSAAMGFALRGRATIAVFLGLPEIAPDFYPRKLMTEGIYGRIRHPRYVQILIALVGYSLIANYLASYLIVALWVPAVYIIVCLEEKELREHFGAAYEDYCREVPRFVPRLRGKR